MTEEKFKEIYLSYKEHNYPQEAADSVKRSYVPFEKNQQAYFFLNDEKCDAIQKSISII